MPSIEPVLSALPPRFSKSEEGFGITFEAQNFGQVPSNAAMLRITLKKDDRPVEVAAASISALDPFQKTVLELACGRLFDKGQSYDIFVIIEPDGQSPVSLQRSLIPAPSG